MVLGQREHTLSRIRATFDRLVAEYGDERGFAIPVSVRLGSGRKPSCEAHRLGSSLGMR